MSMEQLEYDEQHMNEANVWAADNRLWVQFYVRPVQNKAKTEAAGRPIFDEVVFVKIIVPGDKNLVFDQPCKEEHRYRFPKQWERFKSGQKQALEGTPLETVTWLTVGQVAEFKALNIATVEQLSDVPDQLAQRFMGAFELRRKAQAFLEAAKGEAATSKLAAELSERDAKIAALEAQMAELIKVTGQKQAANKAA